MLFRPQGAVDETRILTESNELRVVSWNVNERRCSWDAIKNLGADVVLI